MPLHTALFIESNPSPVKYAASLLNLSSDGKASSRKNMKNKKRGRKALKIYKLLK